jgi:hypothetical protein
MLRRTSSTFDDCIDLPHLAAASVCIKNLPDIQFARQASGRAPGSRLSFALARPLVAPSCFCSFSRPCPLARPLPRLPSLLLTKVASRSPEFAPQSVGRCDASRFGTPRSRFKLCFCVRSLCRTRRPAQRWSRCRAHCCADCQSTPMCAHATGPRMKGCIGRGGLRGGSVRVHASSSFSDGTAHHEMNRVAANLNTPKQRGAEQRNRTMN